MTPPKEPRPETFVPIGARSTHLGDLFPGDIVYPLNNKGGVIRYDVDTKIAILRPSREIYIDDAHPERFFGRVGIARVMIENPNKDSNNILDGFIVDARHIEYGIEATEFGNDYPSDAEESNWFDEDHKDRLPISALATIDQFEMIAVLNGDEAFFPALKDLMLTTDMLAAKVKSSKQKNRKTEKNETRNKPHKKKDGGGIASKERPTDDE